MSTYLVYHYNTNDKWELFRVRCDCVEVKEGVVFFKKIQKYSDNEIVAIVPIDNIIKIIKE